MPSVTYTNNSTVIYAEWLNEIDQFVFNFTYPVVIQAACSDETTNLTTGTGKVVFRSPYAFTLSDVRASLTTAATGATLFTVDVKLNGISIFSTLLTFDAGEKTTVTATTQRVLSTTAIYDDDEISVDVTAVGSTTAGKGLKITLLGTRSL